jgi:hypothetical protein
MIARMAFLLNNPTLKILYEYPWNPAGLHPEFVPQSGKTFFFGTFLEPQMNADKKD